MRENANHPRVWLNLLVGPVVFVRLHANAVDMAILEDKTLSTVVRGLWICCDSIVGQGDFFVICDFYQQYEIIQSNNIVTLKRPQLPLRGSRRGWLLLHDWEQKSAWFLGWLWLICVQYYSKCVARCRKHFVAYNPC